MRQPSHHGSLTAVVDQPQSAEAAKETEAGAVELSQHLRVRVVDGLAKDVAEFLVELLGGIEALFGAAEKLRLGVYAGGGRRGQQRGLLIRLEAQPGGPHA